MAKQRNYNGNSRRNNKKGGWKPEYSSKGIVEFTLNGYVQKISEGEGRDFVQFTIDNPYVAGNYNSITVEVSWEGFPQLELGDHVEIFGMIRSWWNEDINRVTYSLHAEQVKVIEDEEPELPKGRRGVPHKTEFDD